ncbi:hypothetical protein BU17DRAFT_43511 [Hysterangium stoloniferum]|nr:hypothetical protein BU17DRAFT_43511 [Hysterangium stoloniferum]
MPASHAFAPHTPSRSPLRNGVTLDPATGTLSEDGSSNEIDVHDPWGRSEMSHSPASSINQFASSFAQRVGSLVSSVSPGSQNARLPTEAELEAEAESQRERSRREAERILTREAVERKKVEDRVLEMLEASKTRPTRSQTTPSPGAPSSPSTSHKEGSSWWTAAKSKLTPTKELTPAQQIVLDTKAKEKEKRKSRDKDWPTNPAGKFQDPTYQSLSLPPGARPASGGPRTPSPSRNSTHMSLNLSNNGSTPDLSRLPGSSPAPSASSRDPPPLYAQFSPQGTLDVPATLLTIARRFEKLERWAVGHVRALEERMGDVEKWLVDKERQRELDQEVKRNVNEMKDELGELRNRVGELGREMARIVTSAHNAVTHPVSPTDGTGPNTPVVSSARILPLVPIEQNLPRHTQSPSAHSIAQSETASIISTSTATRTKLPYPTGDYTSPSPPSSPRPSTNHIGNYTANNAASNISRTRPISHADLPMPQSNIPASGIVRATASAASSNSVSPSVSQPTNAGSMSISPSPRKRYTVALGQPLSSSPSTSSQSPVPPSNMSRDLKKDDFGDNLFSEPQELKLHTAFFSHVPIENDDDDDDDENPADETIGKTAITLSRLSTSPPPSQTSSPNRSAGGLHRGSPRHSPSNPRLRAQSTYGVPGSSSSRSRSIDRFNVGPSSEGTRNFMDPLVIRKKEKTAARNSVVLSPGGPRGRVADLLAFFDADKQQ